MDRKPIRRRPTCSVKALAASAGFTLVEILIVVVILGILAAIVIPQFTGAAAETRENSLKMDLYRIRQQIEVYYVQHNAIYPTLAEFEAQMTGATDVWGNPAVLGAPGSHGPYLERIPKNPQTGTNTLSNGAVGASDWFYDESNGDFFANDSAASRLY